jgi:DNA-binding MarR family transcriptional regulator
MTKKGSSPKGPSRRSTKVTPFMQEFPGSSESANATVIALVRTADALMAASNALMASYGLSAAGRQALAILEGAAGPLSPTEISQRMFTTTASTTSLLDTLEQGGYVTRARHPDDRRKVLVTLTPVGRDLVDDYLPKLVALQTAALADVDESAREHLQASLATMQATVAALDVAQVAAQTKPRGKPQQSSKPDS